MAQGFRTPATSWAVQTALVARHNSRLLQHDHDRSHFHGVHFSTQMHAVEVLHSELLQDVGCRRNCSCQNSFFAGNPTVQRPGFQAMGSALTSSSMTHERLDMRMLRLTMIQVPLLPPVTRAAISRRAGVKCRFMATCEQIHGMGCKTDKPHDMQCRSVPPITMFVHHREPDADGHGASPCQCTAACRGACSPVKFECAGSSHLTCRCSIGQHQQQPPHSARVGGPPCVPQRRTMSCHTHLGHERLPTAFEGHEIGRQAEQQLALRVHGLRRRLARLLCRPPPPRILLCDPQLHAEKQHPGPAPQTGAGTLAAPCAWSTHVDHELQLRKRVAVSDCSRSGSIVSRTAGIQG